MLEIVPDTITHTSDHFDEIYELAVQLITSGRAYADDTDNTVIFDSPCSCPPETHGKFTRMAHERWHGIPSKRRDASVEENLKRFQDMKDGVDDPQGARWCLRAKISVDDPNNAMRDPVIYRTNTTAHHRTGWASYLSTYLFWNSS